MASRTTPALDAATRPESAPAVPRAAWACLAACTATAALLQIDGTLVTVALPALGRDLDVSSGATSWILTAYFLAYGLMLVPGGRLVDHLGVRRIAIAGLALFALGAMIGAVAPSFGVLVGSRVVQGVAAGLVSPAALAGAVSPFPAAKRGMALGIWGAGSGIANLVGPLLGGGLTVGLGWRACWWALVPLAAAAIVGMARLAPGRSAVETAAGAPPPESRVIITAATGLAGLTFVLMIGSFLLGQQYLQHVVHQSALGAAATLLVVTLLSALASPLAGRLADRRGEPLPIVIGLTLAAAALAVLGIGSVPLDQPLTIVLLVPFGLGLGLLFSPVSRAALNSVPSARHGRVSATLSVGRLAGAALGAALVGFALDGGVTSMRVHHALLAGALMCLAGLPLARRLSSRAPATGAS
jgi:MFS family permease